MTTPSKTRFYAEVKSRVPGVTDGVIDLQLGSLLMDFLEETNSWFNDVSLDVVATTLAYDLEPDEGSVNRVISILDENDNPVEADLVLQDNGSPQLVLRQALANSATWTVRTALLPNIHTPLNVPDWVYDQYRLTLLDGMMSRLMLQPSKPFTNQQLGIYHDRLYRAGTARARVEQTRSYRFGVQAWRFPTNFSTRRR